MASHLLSEVEWAVTEYILNVEPHYIPSSLVASHLLRQSLITFVNKQLNLINLEVNDLENDFSDGVYLCMLMGLLEGYFVPLHHFYITPKVRGALSG